jgi:hypothetical protein
VVPRHFGKITKYVRRARLKPEFDVATRRFAVQGAMLEHTDFSVVVKNRARPPKPWRWEIYRAGRTSPVDHSEVYFESMSEASRAGKAALKQMLGEPQG